MQNGDLISVKCRSDDVKPLTSLKRRFSLTSNNLNDVDFKKSDAVATSGSKSSKKPKLIETSKNEDEGSSESSSEDSEDDSSKTKIKGKGIEKSETGKLTKKSGIQKTTQKKEESSESSSSSEESENEVTKKKSKGKFQLFFGGESNFELNCQDCYETFLYLRISVFNAV